MTYKEWMAKYKPILNPYCSNLLNVWKFEANGEELDHVHRVLENNKQSLWTLMSTNGANTITPGYHHNGRLGYFITEVTWDDEAIAVPID